MLQRIGKYEILDQIGRGGQGTVYRVRDTDLDRIVAIKVIDQSVVDDPGYLDALRREAQLAASLDHPNIVSVYAFEVEKGKKQVDKVRVPVLFGRNGEPELTFEADAAKPDSHIVLEVEAGRAVSNFQFLKDLFEACMMQNILFAGIAVRNEYRYGKSRSRDFDYVTRFLDTLYASGRLTLPLQGILVIGY